VIAFCGLNCRTCPIHLATLEPDHSRRHAMRIDIARICTEQYGMNLRPEDVSDCDGCRSFSGRLFSGCLDCEIRKCAIDRKLTSCAYCVDFTCPTLGRHFQLDPDARIRLEAARQA
jgi:hypothetical protein